MDKKGRLRSAQSSATDAREAAREFHARAIQPGMAFVIFFCSSHYDLDALASEIDRLFVGVQVVGCTTAGEIGPAGYLDHSITGVSFPADSFTATSGMIDQLQQFEPKRARSLAQDLMQRLEESDPGVDEQNAFALMLIDGMSVREERVARALQNALGRIPVVGGSAGDDRKFDTTYVYFEGAFHADSALVVVVTTPLAFRPIRAQHFVPTSQRVVVTRADAEHRIVWEIDGRPAVEAYAELVGAEVDELGPALFAEEPMLVVIGGANFTRSIQTANPDGSLTLFCAIEEGVVLRRASGVDPVQNLLEVLAETHEAIGPPQLVIGFECTLRRLEIARRGLVGRVAEILRDASVVGFGTYGEQYRGVHVNQTLTGIAIGQYSGD